MVVAAAAVGSIVGQASRALPDLVALAVIYPLIAIAAKRWHDRGKSAWWILIGLIPLVGPIWALVETGFLDGTPGPNDHGPAAVPVALSASRPSAGTPSPHQAHTAVPTAWPDGMLVGFDLETTSTDPMTALPVSYALSFFDGQKLVSTQRALINPGVPIPLDAIAVHGITDEMVRSEGVRLDVGVPNVVGVLREYSALGRPVVGMKLPYDLTIIDRIHRETFAGAGLTELGWNGPAIDISVIDHRVDKWRKGKRTLSALCEHYRVDLRDAHKAGADAEASVRVALAIAKTYPEIGQSSPRELHDNQAMWHCDWADDFSAWRVRQGQEALEPSEGDWPFSRA